MPSPVRDSVPTFPLPTELQAPPSPRTHRALRRLQSAHTLGAKAATSAATAAAISIANPPSLIAQQRREQQAQQHQVHVQGSNQAHGHPQAHNQGYQQAPVFPAHLQQQQSQQTQTPQPQPQQYQHPQQQYFQQRNLSPVRRELSASAAFAVSSRSPQRGRANSDAPMVHQIHQAGKRGLVKRTNPVANAVSLQHLLRDGPPDGDVQGALESARVKVLDEGIKSDGDGMSSLRIYAWLIFLDAPILSTNDYLALIHRGASPAYSKIRNDTFRTLTTDPLFRRRVSEASLIRLLNAIAWKLHDVREEQRKDRPGGSTTSGVSSSRSSLAPNDEAVSTIRGTDVFGLGGNTGGGPGALSGLGIGGVGGGRNSTGGIGIGGTSPAAKNRARALTLTTEGSESSVAPEPGTYVQGMNVLAAPFLYAARSEAEAFVAFYSLLTRECPGYIRGAMDGVHKGLALVDKVLAIVDPKLSLYLTSKGMSAEIYAFPSVLTLCACTPPLPEVLRLWDFLFAYGPHLNILCIVAQLWLIRKQILESASPNKLLRSFPALQADLIKRTTLTIIKSIPEDVYAEIVAHAQ